MAGVDTMSLKWLRYIPLVPAFPLLMISIALSSIAELLNRIVWRLINIAEPDED